MNRSRSLSFLLKVSLFALILSALPLPAIVSDVVPFWLLLFYTYWLVYFSSKGRLLIALLLGVILDVLHGDILGQNGLALVLSSAFIIYVKQSFSVSNTSTQQVYVFGAALIYLSSLLAVHLLTQGFNLSYWILLAPLVSALIWPVVYWLLVKCRH